MKVEFTRRATAELTNIAQISREFGPDVSADMERRILTVTEQIAKFPESCPGVEGRKGVRVASLIRYPYRIFYRVLDDRVLIIHIRHTSRHPWSG